MKWRLLLPTVAVIALALGLRAAFDGSGPVEIARLSEENWDQFVPAGKEVDAIYGDIVFRNDYLTAVIAQPRADRNANMTVRTVAGSLIDLTVRGREAESDQLSAYYPGRREYAFRSGEVRGAGEALPLEQLQQVQGDQGSVVLRAEAVEGKPAVEVRYELRAKERFLRITTRYSNPGTAPVTFPLQDDIRADGQVEQMAKTPNGDGDLFWIHDRYWQQAYGWYVPAGKLQFNSDARNTVLTYLDAGQNGPATLAAGESREVTRYLFPGQHLLDVQATAAEIKGTPVHPVTLIVRGPSESGIPGAEVTVMQGANSLGSARTSPEGKISTRLPAGKYTLKISDLGVPVKSTPELTVSGEPQQNFVIDLAEYQVGLVAGKIVDGDGKPIACKVEFQPKAGTPLPNFGPDSGEYAVRNLCYAPHGTFTQRIPPGEYDVIISHGPEYDAVFTDLKVVGGQTSPLTGTLKRVMDTTGWVSSDFHSHSSPSGDNTGSQLGRVLNLLCEHLEFAPCTEHNRISTYVPHIQQLGIEQQMATVSGMELTGTPLPLNHQNVFPLVYKPRTQDGGGPVTDTSPETQIERVALWDNRSEKLVQQNHPDIGWLFYDKDGNGEPDEGYSRGFQFMDVVEIHPLSNAWNLVPEETLPGRTGNNRIFNWLQLLNQGYRIYGVANTDAHYNYHGSGGVRIWIQSDTDNPAELKPMDMVHAAEQGRVIMSNGPFLEVWLSAPGTKKVTAGQDLQAKTGEATLQVKVQAPNWVTVDRLMVLINGQPHPDHNYSKDKHPDLFLSGVVKFDRQLSLKLASDAHVIVVAGSDRATLGPVLGPEWGKQNPTAISNPIYVDTNGNGFEPNKDTLGHPLPVKAGTRK